MLCCRTLPLISSFILTLVISSSSEHKLFCYISFDHSYTSYLSFRIYLKFTLLWQRVHLYLNLNISHYPRWFVRGWLTCLWPLYQWNKNKVRISHYLLGCTKTGAFRTSCLTVTPRPGAVGAASRPCRRWAVVSAMLTGPYELKSVLISHGERQRDYRRIHIEISTIYSSTLHTVNETSGSQTTNLQKR